jgi:hypothetical protein
MLSHQLDEIALNFTAWVLSERCGVQLQLEQKEGHQQQEALKRRETGEPLTEI